MDILINKPDEEPTTETGFKNYAELPNASFDAPTVAALLIAAREAIEFEMNISLCKSREIVIFDIARKQYTLLHSPVVSVTEVTLIDSQGSTRVLLEDEYTVLGNSEKILCITVDIANYSFLQIKYQAGYATSEDVPKLGVMGIYDLAMYWHDNKADSGRMPTYIAQKLSGLGKRKL